MELAKKFIQDCLVYLDLRKITVKIRKDRGLSQAGSYYDQENQLISLNPKEDDLYLGLCFGVEDSPVEVFLHELGHAVHEEWDSSDFDKGVLEARAFHTLTYSGFFKNKKPKVCFLAYKNTRLEKVADSLAKMIKEDIKKEYSYSEEMLYQIDKEIREYVEETKNILKTI